MSEPTLGERLAVIETKLDNISETLLGNGQPGAIDKLNTRVEGLEKDVAEAKGAYLVGSTLMSALVGWLSSHVGR